MDIIVCLTPKKQFGRVVGEDLYLVTDINEATKFTDEYKEEMTYFLNMFREKYIASTFVCCNINSVILDEPIQDVMDEHVLNEKLVEVIY